MPEMNSAGKTVSVTGVGSTEVCPIYASQQGKHTQTLLPAILCAVTGTVTYTVQVTGDNLENNFVAASANWYAFDGMSALTAAANGTLTGRVTGIRGTITAGTGTLTMTVVV